MSEGLQSVAHKMHPTYRLQPVVVQSLASNAIESQLAVGTAAGSIHIVDAYKWCEDGPFMIPHEYVNEEFGCAVESLSFCANDQLIVAVYGGGVIRVWDVDKRVQVGRTYTDGPRLQNKEKVFVAEEFKVCWYTAYGGKFEILDIRDIVNGSA